MNRNPKNRLKSLSIEKPLGFLIKKLSAWRNLFPDRETCFKRKCAGYAYVRRYECLVALHKDK